MTIGPDAYAELSKDSYNEHKLRDEVVAGGVAYRVIDTVNHSQSGFEATAYQRVETGEVVIAYRGTEAAKLKLWDEPTKDLGADYQMVRDQANKQLPNAEAFTDRVMQNVRANAEKYHQPAPQITVTGHSLGGTLAEIEASRHRLGGAGFNAYGAADLKYGVPEGQPKDAPAFTGYARASDVVSSASPHYGTMHIYATQQDIASLQAGRYLEPPSTAHPTDPLLTADLNAHFVTNFSPDPGKGETIMTAANEARYQQYQGAIDHYRSDVMASRIDLHDVLNHSRDPARAARLEAKVEDALHVASYGAAVRTGEFAAGVPLAERELNATAHGAHATGQAVHAGADGLAHGTQATGQAVQAGADHAAQGLHNAGQAAQRTGDAVSREAQVLSPVDPLMAAGVALGAKGAGYVMHAEAEGLAASSHLAGHAARAAAEAAAQKIHAAGEVAHVALDAVSAKANAVSQSIHDTAQAAASTQTHDAVMDKVHQSERTVGAVVQGAAQGVQHAGAAIGQAASQSYDTLTHPGAWFDSKSSTPGHATVAPASAHAPSDPRRPDHPQHAQYEKTAALVAGAYAKHGISQSPEQLERTTAQVMLDAQKRPVKDIKEVHLNPDPGTRHVHANSNMMAFSGDPCAVTTLRCSTDMQQARQTPPEQNFQQLEQVQQQQAQVAMQQVQTPTIQGPGGGPGMGGPGGR